MKLPRVLIDARMVRAHSHDGIARYVFDLARGLAKIKNLPYKIEFLADESLQNRLPWSEFKLHFHGIPFLSLTEPFRLREVLQDLKPELFHSPSFSSVWRSPVPWIVTIHDLNHLHYGSWLKKLYYRMFLKPFALRAKKVVSVSKFSCEEIANWTGIPVSEIEEVPNAIDFSELSTEPKNISGMSANYFLALSNPKAHKNLSLLVEAYRAYRQKATQPWPLKMTCAVGDFGSQPGEEIVLRSTNSDVQALLRRAGALVFPSLYEGFGRPPLEALGLGVPVLASAIPPIQQSFQAIFGKDQMVGAQLLAPDCIESWAMALYGCSDKERIPPSPETQLKVTQVFSVENLAGRMDHIYRRVLSLGP